jgi:hypothetical protein
MSNGSVIRVTIHLGNIPLDVFQLEDGSYILSQDQVFEAVDVINKNYPRFLRSEKLDSLPCMESLKPPIHFKGISKIKPLTIEQASAIWGALAAKGNLKAIALLVASATEAIERRADIVFGKVRTEAERNERFKSRIAGKVSRRTWTQAIADYVNTHEVSDNYRQWIYINVSDTLNLALFGKKAKQLCEERGCTKETLRDTHDEANLRLIDRIEDYAMRLTDRGLEPKLAIAEAIEFYR